MGEEGTAQPWNSLPSVSDSMRITMEAATAGTGAGDIACLFDGGSREVRRELDTTVSKAGWNNEFEVTIVFQAPRKAPTGGRANTFSRRNIESARVMTRFSNNKWKVVERSEFNIAGEEFSLDATYTGVPIRNRNSLHRLGDKERAKIIGQSPVPPAGLFNVAERGHPFSWYEKKPISWYQTFLKEIAAKLVIDLTPGSGAMARACLDEGIQYVGICRSQQHCSWLVNILNRAAVESTVRSGTALYAQDATALINDHFKELIDELHTQDAAVSDDEEVQ
jgi:hypothetical protein